MVEDVFLPPNIQSSLVSVISTYGKKNTDSDRNILKDLTGKGNDFKLLNFEFAGNSGYGKYKEDFTTWVPQYNIADSTHTSNKLHITKVKLPNAILYTRKAVKSMKVEVKGSRNIELYYRYSSEENVSKLLMLDREGIYELPDSLDFNYTGFEIHNYVGDCDITITQIPDFEGWLCTDGVDDIIESVKPVSEMLEGSNEITVVSIIHGIGSKNAYTNVLRESGSNYIRNTSTADGKTGIYGYTCKDTTKSIITNILGDKNDYKLEYTKTITPSTVNSVFSVAGWRENNGSMIVYPVAYAGGFIANKVLTTDEINQVIAYYNLDRPGEIIKPSMLYDIRKQGITNINHAEFNDELIDYINGYNIKMYNMLWDKQSGIGNYPISFKDYIYIFPLEVLLK